MSDYGNNAVVPISTATNTAGTAIPVDQGPTGVAITPDGTTVYVGCVFAGTVVPISTATDTAEAPVHVASSPLGIAVTPDGSTVYVGLYAGGSDVVRIATVSNTLVGTVATPNNAAWGLAITPDAAPVASFTATPAAAGSPSQFDATSSTSPGAGIVSYRWSFGDGSPVVTAGPTVSHTYAAPGSYVVRLTLVDADGTSTTPVFTGQTVSRDGNRTATKARTIDVT